VMLAATPSSAIPYIAPCIAQPLLKPNCQRNSGCFLQIDPLSSPNTDSIEWTWKSGSKIDELSLRFAVLTSQQTH
jgi:hypothetical protein